MNLKRRIWLATERRRPPLAAISRRLRRCRPVAGVAARRPSEGKHPLSSHTEHEVSSSKFAFPRERKEPLTDARHVPNAIARFNQVEDVSKSERDAAWRRIKSAAKKYGIEISHKPKARSR